VNMRGKVVPKDAGGRSPRMVGVVFDITERQEAFARWPTANGASGC